MTFLFIIFIAAVFLVLPYLMARLASYILGVRDRGARWCIFALMVVATWMYFHPY